MTQISDIRSKTPDELKEMTLSLRKEMFNLRFQAAAGEAVPVARFRAARADIARIKTVMNDPQQKMTVAAKPAKAASKAAPAKAAAKESKPKKAPAKKTAS
jgi:large subunit ribosomal protein L29